MDPTGADDATRRFRREAGLTAAATLIMCLLGSSMVYSRLGISTATLLVNMKRNRLTLLETDLLTRGYYEELDDVDRFNDQLWTLYQASNKRQRGSPNLMQNPSRFLGNELAPSFTGMFRGGTFRTNRWGMRDRDYSVIAPPEVYRIALLGGSQELGSGVNEGESFESLLEARLNAPQTPHAFARYEILNFAAPNRDAVQQPAALELKALAFRPKAVFFVAHLMDVKRSRARLSRFVRDGVAIPYPELVAIVSRSGARGNDLNIIERMLKPYEYEIQSWAYRRMVMDCRSRSAIPVFILLPLPVHAGMADERRLNELAKQAGFVTLPLGDVYAGQDQESLVLREDETHLNARGHRLVADKIFEALRDHNRALGLGLFK
jgi:hypothetical protein